MNPQALKPIGILILALGVMIAAGAGVQFGSGDFAAATAKGEAAIAGSEVVVPNVDNRLGEWSDLHLLQFIIGIGFIVGGGLVARKANAAQRDQIIAGESEARDWQQELEKIEQAITEVHDMLATDNADFLAARQKLDALRTHVLEPLIEARVELQIRYGLSGFAQVMGPLSAAERFVNRTWTVLVDNHGEAALQSIDAAKLAIAETLREYKQLNS